MKTFQEWYTGITVEGPMEHMMERAWNAAIAGADARVLADMKKRLAYGPNDEAAIGAYEQDRIAEQVHRELYSGAPAQAEPSDDARDAARYRWLRDAENGGQLSVGRQIDVHDEYPAYEQVDWLYEDMLDAAIDAAMQEG